MQTDAPFTAKVVGTLVDAAPTPTGTCVANPVGPFVVSLDQPVLGSGGDFTDGVTAVGATSSTPFAYDVSLEPVSPLVEGRSDSARVGTGAIGDDIVVPCPVRGNPGTPSDSFTSGTLDGFAVEGTVDIVESSPELPADDGYAAMTDDYFQLFRPVSIPDTEAPALEAVLRAVDGYNPGWAVEVEVVAGEDRVDRVQPLPATKDLTSESTMPDPVPVHLDLSPLRGREAMIRIMGGAGLHRCTNPPNWAHTWIDGLRVVP